VTDDTQLSFDTGEPEAVRLTGTAYRRLIGRYVLRNYATHGIDVYEEVNVGTSIIGKQRRLDLLLLQRTSGRSLALECKYQEASGTVDEKIPYALDDLRALRMPGVIAYGGGGFSEGVLHLLQSSEHAAYCLPGTELEPAGRRTGGSMDSGTWQLDHVLALTFGLWDIILAGKRPLAP
jgi:hypothetical protein